MSMAELIAKCSSFLRIILSGRSTDTFAAARHSKVRLRLVP